MKNKSTLSIYALIMILMTSIGLLASSVYSYFIAKPAYESKTEMIIQTKGKNNNDVQTMMTTTKDILNSQNMLLSIQNHLKNEGIDYSTEQLEKALDLTIERQSKAVDLTVTTDNPLIAQQIAQIASSLYKEQLTRVMNDTTLSIVAKPSFNPKEKNKHYIDLLIGSGIGLLLGLIVLCFMQWKNMKIKNRQRLTRYAVPVIASIPQMTSKEKSVRIHRVNKEETEQTQNKKLDEDNEMVDQLLRQETQQLDTLIRRRRKR